ncbi:MAG: helix-turn-helix domain-containing protein [Mycobacterium sp.]|nr:helix-turn-helix domain-containing protein [Mycobacterium sp.]
MSTSLALAPAAAAEQIAVTVQTLKRWRAKGIGPAYVRMEGGQVRYRPADLEAWLVAHRQQ